jgi:hypothetical protein
VLRFFVILSILAAIGGGAAYFTTSYFLPSVYNPQGKIDVEILKVLPAAIAAVVASVIAATTAVINVGLQLRTAKQLETHRVGEQLKANQLLADNAQTFTREMEKEKNKFIDEMEDKKKVYTAELDRRKQELAHQLGIEKIDIERRLEQVNNAEQIAREYRYLIGQIRVGMFLGSDISAMFPKMADIANDLDSKSELCRVWRWFSQLGIYLYERASKLKSTSGRRRLWEEIDEKTGITYGKEFVAKAEEIRALLVKRREEIVAESIT